MAQQGKPVWFITGCSTGFGKELAQLVLSKGWNAVITARKPEQLDGLVAGYEEHALALRLDVTEPAHISAAVEAAEARFGRIDVLVNNAGYGYLAAVEEGEDDEIRKMFETNFFGLVSLTNRVLPGMRKQHSGRIINISSIGGLVSFAATGYYHATKYALEGLSESLALEVAPLGIQVMIVEPGPFRTDWAGRSLLESKVVISDYDSTAGERRRLSRERSGKQQGDPRRGAAAIVEAASADKMPLHLLLGAPAYEMGHKKLEALRQVFDSWESTTLGADYPEFQKSITNR